MPVLRSEFTRAPPAVRAKGEARKTRNLHLAEQLREKLAKLHLGGGEKAVALHRKRNKCLPRERIQKIVDPGTRFLEICALAGRRSDFRMVNVESDGE